MTDIQNTPPTTSPSSQANRPKLGFGSALQPIQRNPRLTNTGSPVSPVTSQPAPAAPRLSSTFKSTYAPASSGQKPLEKYKSPKNNPNIVGTILNGLGVAADFITKPIGAAAATVGFGIRLTAVNAAEALDVIGGTIPGLVGLTKEAIADVGSLAKYKGAGVTGNPRYGTFSKAADPILLNSLKDAAGNPVIGPDGKPVLMDRWNSAAEDFPFASSFISLPSTVLAPSYLGGIVRDFRDGKPIVAKALPIALLFAGASGVIGKGLAKGVASKTATAEAGTEYVAAKAAEKAAGVTATEAKATYEAAAKKAAEVNIQAENLAAQVSAEAAAKTAMGIPLEEAMVAAEAAVKARAGLAWADLQAAMGETVKANEYKVIYEAAEKARLEYSAKMSEAVGMAQVQNWQQAYNVVQTVRKYSNQVAMFPLVPYVQGLRLIGKGYRSGWYLPNGSLRGVSVPNAFNAWGEKGVRGLANEANVLAEKIDAGDFNPSVTGTVNGYDTIGPPKDLRFGNGSPGSLSDPIKLAEAELKRLRDKASRLMAFRMGREANLVINRNIQKTETAAARRRTQWNELISRIDDSGVALTAAEQGAMSIVYNGYYVNIVAMQRATGLPIPEIIKMTRYNANDGSYVDEVMFDLANDYYTNNITEEKYGADWEALRTRLDKAHAVLKETMRPVTQDALLGVGRKLPLDIRQTDVIPFHDKIIKDLEAIVQGRAVSLTPSTPDDVIRAEFLLKVIEAKVEKSREDDIQIFLDENPQLTVDDITPDIPLGVFQRSIDDPDRRAFIQAIWEMSPESLKYNQDNFPAPMRPLIVQAQRMKTNLERQVEEAGNTDPIGPRTPPGAPPKPESLQKIEEGLDEVIRQHRLNPRKATEDTIKFFNSLSERERYHARLLYKMMKSLDQMHSIYIKNEYQLRNQEIIDAWLNNESVENLLAQNPELTEEGLKQIVSTNPVVMATWEVQKAQDSLAKGVATPKQLQVSQEKLVEITAAELERINLLKQDQQMLFDAIEEYQNYEEIRLATMLETEGVDVDILRQLATVDGVNELAGNVPLELSAVSEPGVLTSPAAKDTTLRKLKVVLGKKEVWPIFSGYITRFYGDVGADKFLYHNDGKEFGVVQILNETETAWTVKMDNPAIESYMDYLKDRLSRPGPIGKSMAKELESITKQLEQQDKPGALTSPVVPGPAITAVEPTPKPLKAPKEPKPVVAKPDPRYAKLDKEIGILEKAYNDARAAAPPPAPTAPKGKAAPAATKYVQNIRLTIDNEVINEYLEIKYQGRIDPNDPDGMEFNVDEEGPPFIHSNGEEYGAVEILGRTPSSDPTASASDFTTATVAMSKAAINDFVEYLEDYIDTLKPGQWNYASLTEALASVKKQLEYLKYTFGDNVLAPPLESASAPATLTPPIASDAAKGVSRQLEVAINQVDGYLDYEYKNRPRPDADYFDLEIDEDGPPFIHKRGKKFGVVEILSSTKTARTVKMDDAAIKDYIKYLKRVSKSLGLPKTKSAVDAELESITKQVEQQDAAATALTPPPVAASTGELSLDNKPITDDLLRRVSELSGKSMPKEKTLKEIADFIDEFFAPIVPMGPKDVKSLLQEYVRDALKAEGFLRMQLHKDPTVKSIPGSGMSWYTDGYRIIPKRMFPQLAELENGKLYSDPKATKVSINPSAAGEISPAIADIIKTVLKSPTAFLEFQHTATMGAKGVGVVLLNPENGKYYLIPKETYLLGLGLAEGAFSPHFQIDPSGKMVFIKNKNNDIVLMGVASQPKGINLESPMTDQDLADAVESMLDYGTKSALGPIEVSYQPGYGPAAVKPAAKPAAKPAPPRISDEDWVIAERARIEKKMGKTLGSIRGTKQKLKSLNGTFGEGLLAEKKLDSLNEDMVRLQEELRNINPANRPKETVIAPEEPLPPAVLAAPQPPAQLAPVYDAEAAKRVLIANAKAALDAKVQELNDLLAADEIPATAKLAPADSPAVKAVKDASKSLVVRSVKNFAQADVPGVLSINSMFQSPAAGKKAIAALKLLAESFPNPAQPEQPYPVVSIYGDSEVLRESLRQLIHFTISALEIKGTEKRIAYILDRVQGINPELKKQLLSGAYRSPESIASIPLYDSHHPLTKFASSVSQKIDLALDALDNLRLASERYADVNYVDYSTVPGIERVSMSSYDKLHPAEYVPSYRISADELNFPGVTKPEIYISAALPVEMAIDAISGFIKALEDNAPLRPKYIENTEGFEYEDLGYYEPRLKGFHAVMRPSPLFLSKKNKALKAEVIAVFERIKSSLEALAPQNDIIEKLRISQFGTITAPDNVARLSQIKDALAARPIVDPSLTPAQLRKIVPNKEELLAQRAIRNLDYVTELAMEIAAEELAAVRAAKTTKQLSTAQDALLKKMQRVVNADENLKKAVRENLENPRSLVLEKRRSRLASRIEKAEAGIEKRQTYRVSLSAARVALEASLGINFETTPTTPEQFIQMVRDFTSGERLPASPEMGMDTELMQNPIIVELGLQAEAAEVKMRNLGYSAMARPGSAADILSKNDFAQIAYNAAIELGNANNSIDVEIFTQDGKEYVQFGPSYLPVGNIESPVNNVTTRVDHEGFVGWVNSRSSYHRTAERESILDFNTMGLLDVQQTRILSQSEQYRAWVMGVGKTATEYLGEELIFSLWKKAEDYAGNLPEVELFKLYPEGVPVEITPGIDQYNPSLKNPQTPYNYAVQSRFGELIAKEMQKSLKVPVLIYSSIDAAIYARDINAETYFIDAAAKEIYAQSKTKVTNLTAGVDLLRKATASFKWTTLVLSATWQIGDMTTNAIWPLLDDSITIPEMIESLKTVYGAIGKHAKEASTPEEKARRIRLAKFLRDSGVQSIGFDLQEQQLLRGTQKFLQEEGVEKKNAVLRALDKSSRGIDKARDWSFALNAATNTVQRYAVFYNFMDIYLREQGISWDDFLRDETYAASPEYIAKAEEFANETNDLLGDVVNLSKNDKRIFMLLFPFWAWIKQSHKIFFRLAKDHPARLQFIMYVGMFAMDEDNKKDMQMWDGTVNILGKNFNTSWLNPFYDVVDGPVINLVGAMLGSEQYDATKWIQSVNPMIRIPVAGVSGFDLKTLKPVTRPSGSGYYNLETGIERFKPLLNLKDPSELLGYSIQQIPILSRIAEAIPLKNIPGTRIALGPVVKYGTGEARINPRTGKRNTKQGGVLGALSRIVSTPLSGTTLQQELDISRSSQARLKTIRELQREYERSRVP